MWSRSGITAVLLLAFVLPASAQAPHLATDLEKFSYALGLRFGQSLAQQGLKSIDPAALGLGVQDMLAGVNPRITPEQIQAAQDAIVAEIRKAARDKAKKTLDEGLSFLEANKNRDGVITLPSGVQYRILREGDGKQPTPEDKVVVHYRGTLLTGQEFDSSYNRGEPLTFGLGQVIPGWTQVVSSIKTGSKIETWIPPNLAYGERGSPPTIPGNSTLYFQIELLEVK